MEWALSPLLTRQDQPRFASRQLASDWLVNQGSRGPRQHAPLIPDAAQARTRVLLHAADYCACLLHGITVAMCYVWKHSPWFWYKKTETQISYAFHKSYGPLEIK